MLNSCASQNSISPVPESARIHSAFCRTVAHRGGRTSNGATMKLTEKELKNFWKKVKKTDGCWEWIGGKFTSGYGLYKVQGITSRVHRLSWEIHNGTIPEGMCVCHSCDNPPCVNPNHLWLGTSQENTQDKMSKGRHKYQSGESHYAAKLTDQQVEEIRTKSTGKRGEGVRLAKEYGVSKSLISAIILSKKRTH